MNAPVLRVGCPMWANRDWVGRWFPAETASGAELAAYASWCLAVEGNTTFYALPDAATVQRWRDRTPDGFRFCFKLPRTITHQRRLRHADEELAVFERRLEPLGERLGPHSIQLPAAFGPDQLGVLDAFLARCSTERIWSVEVRHPAFHRDGPEERALHEILHRRGAERVVMDTEAFFAGVIETPAEREAAERKPRNPVRPVAIGAHPVVRLVGRSDPARHREDRARWVARLARWIEQGRQPICFVHTPDNRDSPRLARDLHHEVAARVPGLAPLPEARRVPRLF